MPGRPKKKQSTVLAGRRSNEDQQSGRWRLTIRPKIMSEAGYSWETYLVQGWQEGGKWRRKMFKNRAAAEAFVATKQLEQATRQDPRRPAMTVLSDEQVRDAETALGKLSKFTGATLTDAAVHYAAHLNATVSVERVPLRFAAKECIADKEDRKVLRERSAVQLRSTLRLFERWLLMQPRYIENTVDLDWTPDVCEITTGDVRQYLASLRGRDGMVAAPKTRNNVRADLRAFFNWCIGQEDDKPIPDTSRRWHSENPAAPLARVDAPGSDIHVLSAEKADALMRQVESYEGGIMVPYFALSLFGGIRPSVDGELGKLARHPGRDAPCAEAGGRPLIDLARGVITIPASIGKTGKRTGKKRIVTIQPNLKAWLKTYGTEILPAGYDKAVRAIRKSSGLLHDEMRHTFISFHIGAFRSKADTALQAGNSETVIDTHYLNIPTKAEAKVFWKIAPAVPQG